MKKSSKFKWLTMLASVCLCLSITLLNAQVLEKGITSTGKEVDCSTINPSVDKTVNEYGAVVTQPRLTRNGKLITDDCGCPVSIDCTNCTDTVNCISITMSAPILSGNVTSAVLQVFSDAGYTTQVGSDITATVDDGKITATADNLSCYTKYYLRLTLNNNSNCTFDWTDSTRDMTLEKATFCTVSSARALVEGSSDQSHEHLVAGSTTQIDSVYDHEGNAYAVVQIGNQCWLKENMRCESSPLSKLNKAVPSEMNYYSPLYYDNTSSAIPLSQRGYLYNWAAIMDAVFDNSTMPADEVFSNYRGICPQGWHIPTMAEWYEIGNITDTTGQPSIPDAGKYAASCYWTSNNQAASEPGNYSFVNRNESGLSIFPTGDVGGFFDHEGITAVLWTSNSKTTMDADCFDFATDRFSVNLSSQGKASGFAVRCVRDAQAKNYCTVDFALDNEDGAVDGRIDSVYDHEGNAYAVVQIGEQCWLAENMRCTTSPRQGTGVGQVNLQNGNIQTLYNDDPYYYDYSTATQFTLRERGYLYNWTAAMDTFYSSGTNPTDVDFPNHRGICPEGWHLPTDGEWFIFEKNILSVFNFADAPSSGFGSRGKGVGKLTSGSDWYSSGNSTTPNSYSYVDRNITGFSMLPTGYYYIGFYNATSGAYYWTATSHSNQSAYDRAVIYNEEGVTRYENWKSTGFSVRCVRNTPTSATISFHANGGSGTMEPMNVMTMKDTVLDANTFTHGGNFEFAGWSTDQCSSEIAYADGANITPTESITLYAQWHTYCAGTPLNNELGTSRVDSVKDHEENWYKVVQIGNQCWLKENMRCSSGQNYGVFTSYNTTTNTTTATTFSTPSIFANDCGTCTGINQDVSIRNEKGDSNFIQKYGYLYTWEAAIDRHNHTTQQSPPIQGICPEGWHLPTYDEYVTMFDYVKTSLLGQTSAASPVWTKSDNDNPNGVNTDIAVALVGGCDWMSSSVSGSAGDLYNPLRNISGFTALPAHDYNFKFWAVTTHAIFWTATNNATTATSWYLGYNNEGLFYNGPGELSKNTVARSVRCVRD